VNAGKNTKKSPIKVFFGLVILFFDNLAGIQCQIRKKSHCPVTNLNRDEKFLKDLNKNKKKNKSEALSKILKNNFSKK